MINIDLNIIINDNGIIKESNVNIHEDSKLSIDLIKSFIDNQ